MSLPQTLQPAGWPRPRGYANGIRVPAGHDLVFTAGMIGWDETETLVSSEFLPQFDKALRNVAAVLEAAGGQPHHLISHLE